MLLLRKFLIIHLCVCGNVSQPGNNNLFFGGSLENGIIALETLSNHITSQLSPRWKIDNGKWFSVSNLAQ
jgi:hypothetical protein